MQQPAAEMPRPNMSIISWKEQFVTDTVGNSGILKDKKLKVDDCIFFNIRVTPTLRPRVKDVIILIYDRENKKVLLKL